MKEVVKILRCLFVICLLFVSLPNYAQDLHFGQYERNALNLSPSLTGFMKGNLRIAGNYRNQWFKQSSFSTYAFSVDGNIARKQLQYDMLGIGISFYQDVEERSNFSNTNVSLNLAYNVMITKRPLQYIGFGVQTSLLRKQINLMDAVYGTLYETGINTDPLEFDAFNTMKFDIAAGLSYFGYFAKAHMINVGVAVSHITQPDFGLQGTDYLYRKYVGYVLTEFEAGQSGRVWAMPSFYFSKQGPSLEIYPKMKVRFGFDKAINDVFMTVGVGMRMVSNLERKALTNDFVAEVQFHFNQYSLGFSYDVILSELKNAVSRNGGPELSFIADLNFQNSRHRRQPRFFNMMRF